MSKLSRFLGFLMLAAAIVIPFSGAKAGCGDSVTVYAQEGCPWCQKVENFLNENGVQYERIEADFGMTQRLFGKRVVPVTIVDGIYIIGFNESSLRRVLCLAD